jgi:hypothetical protein
LCARDCRPIWHALLCSSGAVEHGFVGNQAKAIQSRMRVWFVRKGLPPQYARVVGFQAARLNTALSGTKPRRYSRVCASGLCARDSRRYTARTVGFQAVWLNTALSGTKPRRYSRVCAPGFVCEGLSPDPARAVGFQAAWCAPESGLANIQAKAIQSRMCVWFVREGLPPLYGMCCWFQAAWCVPENPALSGTKPRRYSRVCAPGFVHEGLPPLYGMRCCFHGNQFSKTKNI